jgi:nitrogen fixation-related uncharacterized protein
MTSVEETRSAWIPETGLDRELIRQELANVLGSSHFCNSKRYPALLVYVVETTLNGHADRIKERTLGVEVFHRTPDYDTNSDTVVRYTAGEVRKRLALYYHETEDRSGVQIVLPTGSYVPEFYRTDLHSEEHPAPPSTSALQLPEFAPAPLVAAISASKGTSRLRRLVFPAVAIAVATVGLAIFFWSRTPHQQTSLDRFWSPVLSERESPALISVGSVVFAPDHPFSGTATADKNNEYPFVSIQMVAAIARLSGLIERRDVEYQVEAAAFTNIAEMRERPVVLVGGYNNTWTLRLLAPLRYSFSPEPVEAIVDREHPEVRWARDKSIPYSSADDYAIFGRFRDPTTNSPVVFAAGLGRNGTEAAAQFVTSPRYMELLEERVGRDFATKNIEAVLKITVVDGKTGAPSIQAVHVW